MNDNDNDDDNDDSGDKNDGGHVYDDDVSDDSYDQAHHLMAMLIFNYHGHYESV